MQMLQKLARINLIKKKVSLQNSELLYRCKNLCFYFYSYPGAGFERSEKLIGENDDSNMPYLEGTDVYNLKYCYKKLVQAHTERKCNEIRFLVSS